jgi:hypothetical protein
MGLAGASLVAAIPGGILFCLMLVAVLFNLMPMPTMLKVASLLLLVVSAAMMLLPAYVLVWYRPAGVATIGQAAAVESTSAMAAGFIHAPEESAEESPAEVESLGEELTEADVSAADEFEEFGSELSGGEVNFDEESLEDAGSEFTEEFEFEDFDEDEPK